MLNVTNTTTFLSSKNVLNIRATTSFKKILKKLGKNKKADIILVERANPVQMTAVLVMRLMGKKFIWAQNFTNPPPPGFYTKLLLNQSDTILVTSKKIAARLHSFGIDKPKIRIKR